MPIDPLKEEFVAVVTSWYTYGQKGGLVGSALPVFCTSKNELVQDPAELFPDPGYVFLVNRGSVVEWDWIIVRPKKNDKYVPGKSFYLSFDIPTALEHAGPEARVASVLDVPGFDPAAPTGLIRSPAQNVLPVFYARHNRRLFGPLKRVKVNRKTGADAIDSLQWAPLADDSSVYEFGEDDLPRYGLSKLTYRHENPDDEPVGRAPIYVLAGPVTTVKSDRAHDRLSASELAEWYVRLRELSDVPESVMRTFKAGPELIADTTPEVVRQRLRRLSTLVGTLDVLQTERALMATRYMESEAAQKQLEQLKQREIERKAKAIDEEVAKLKKDQSKEKYRIQREMDELHAEQERKKKQIREELAALEKERAGAAAAVEALREKITTGVGELGGRLKDELPVFAALTSGLRPAVVAANGDGSHAPAPAPTAATWGSVAIPPSTKDLAAIEDEATFVDQLAWELADEGLYFTRDFLANLYVTLKSSALNLIMGPPGYGKSSVVAALARAMGHGNALLEIAVRRTWSDDRYLLGFYDTFHGRYDPGPTGLATRLLQAQQDWEKSKAGLYLVLLDEFNLAAPEYYFSQLLQVLTRPPEQGRSIRLFDPAAIGPKVEAPVSQLVLHPNVTFWGTINYDETTERLSPRLLDRTGMIFLGVRDVVPSAGGAAPKGAGKGLLARQLVERFTRPAEDCPEDSWLVIEPLLTALRKPSEEWGAGIDLSPRVLDAIKRYLANSKGLLPPERAADFAFEQRVLPVLRGRGPKFAARARAMVEKLTERGLDRSAAHVQESLALAELNFGDVDFLAY
jgi:hypothetical protein